MKSSGVHSPSPPHLRAPCNRLHACCSCAAEIITAAVLPRHFSITTPDSRASAGRPCLRGFRLSPKNVGPISEHAIAGLQERGVPLAEPRMPQVASEADLDESQLIIALKEAEHRPLVLGASPGGATASNIGGFTTSISPRRGLPWPSWTRRSAACSSGSRAGLSRACPERSCRRQQCAASAAVPATCLPALPLSGRFFTSECRAPATVKGSPRAAEVRSGWLGRSSPAEATGLGSAGPSNRRRAVRGDSAGFAAGRSSARGAEGGAAPPGAGNHFCQTVVRNCVSGGRGDRAS